MKANGYLDFDLHVWSDGNGGYVAQVTESPAGASQREPLRAPFSKDSLEVLRLRLENAVLRGRDTRRGPMSSEEKVLRQFGSEMFRFFFKDSGSVADRFSASLAVARAQSGVHDGLRVKLTIEPGELADLPWEYAFDASSGNTAQNYLCLRHQSPFVRYPEAGRVALAPTIERPLRVLGMVANPSGDWTPLKTEQERARIEEAIRSIPDPSAIDFQWVPGDTQEHLLDMMQRQPWHVFHFIGHGGVDEYRNDDGTTGREGYVVLGNGRGGAVQVSAGDLALTLQDGGTLQLAVLNCCDSGRGAGVDSPGAALVRSGIPAVVAMQYPISDDAAIRFSGMFYKCLVAGQPVERALTAARVLMRADSKVEWAIPVLFTRADAGPLFKADPFVPSGAMPIEPSAAAPTDYDRRRRLAQAELRRLFG